MQEAPEFLPIVLYNIIPVFRFTHLMYEQASHVNILGHYITDLELMNWVKCQHKSRDVKGQICDISPKI